MFRNGLRLLEGNFGLHVKSFRGGGRVGSERNNYVKALKGRNERKNEKMKQERRREKRLSLLTRRSVLLTVGGVDRCWRLTL